jgi:hypothetical protein
MPYTSAGEWNRAGCPSQARRGSGAEGGSDDARSEGAVYREETGKKNGEGKQAGVKDGGIVVLVTTTG